MIVIDQLIDIISTAFNAILWSIVFTSSVWSVYILKNKYFHYCPKPKSRNENKNTFNEIQCIKPYSPNILGDKSEIQLSSVYLEESNGENIRNPSLIIQHCMLIVKDCNSLTERLTTLSIGLAQGNENSLKKIVECAKNISLQFDEFVKGMRQPSNLKSLERRAVSLLLAVTRLAAIAQFECHAKFLPVDWIENSLQDIEKYVKSLRFTTLMSSLEENTSHTKSFIY